MSQLNRRSTAGEPSLPRPPACGLVLADGRTACWQAAGHAGPCPWPPTVPVATPRHQGNGIAAVTAATNGAKAGNGRTGRQWRFVLLVEPASWTAAEPRTPYGVTLSAAHALGPGATPLKEPYEPTVKIRFDRPAPTRVEAIVAAVQSTERCGLRVLRVDNDDWVTAADIAHRVGWSRETVRLWAAGRVGPDGFPPPANPRRDTTFYRWSEVLPWLRERKGVDLPEEEPALVAANLAVQLRALLPRLARPELILTLLHPPR